MKRTKIIFLPIILILLLCFNLLYAATAVSAEQTKVDIYVFHDPRETFIHLGPWNYPEVATLTFVAVTHDPVIGEPILYDGLIRILIDKTRSKFVPFQLVNVTDDKTEMFSDRSHIAQRCETGGWRGLFYELDHSGIGPFLSNFSRYGGNQDGIPPLGSASLEIELGAARNPTVIAVESWNCDTGAKLNFNLTVTEHPANVDVRLMKQSQNVSVDTDNINLVRSVIYRNGGMGKSRPPKGTPYTGDPGPWIIDFGDKTIDPNTGYGTAYGGLLGALVNAEKYGGPWPVPGDGPDWLQVAAAERTSANIPVYNCVWKIIAVPNLKIDGMEGWGLAGRGWIKLNSSHHSIRLNGPSLGNRYGFFGIKRMRDGRIDHEALHTYHFLPGNSVYDDDEDELYVSSATEDTQNPFLNFSFDSYVRGFMEPNYYEYYTTVDQWYNGYHGDKRGALTKNSKRIGRFIMTLEASDFIAALFGDPTNGIPPKGIWDLIPTLIPDDIPEGKAVPAIVGVYLYKPSWTKYLTREYQIASSWIEFVQKHTIPPNSDPQGRRIGENGYYVPQTHLFKFGHYPADVKKIVQLIKNYGYTKLVILYQIEYKNDPYEYDASYFGARIY